MQRNPRFNADSSYTSANGGGGGGAVGRIRISSVETFTPAGLLSPDSTTSAFSQGEPTSY